MALNVKERKFVAEVLKGTPATRALKLAGYRARTEKIAGANAARLMNRPAVKAAIEAVQVKALTAADVTVERTVRELARLAFVDPKRLVDANGSPRTLAELDDDTAAAVRRFVVTEVKGKGGRVSRTTKVTLTDKGYAVDRILRMFGLYRDAYNPDPPAAGSGECDLRRLTDQELELYERLLAKMNGEITIVLPDNGRDPEVRRQGLERSVGQKLAVLGGAVGVDEIIVSTRQEAADVLKAAAAALDAARQPSANGTGHASD